jgi:OOP family OmpA-OmpF porin
MKAPAFFTAVALVAFIPQVSHAVWRENPWRDPAAPEFIWPAKDSDQDGIWDRVDHCVGTKKGCPVDQFGCSTDSDKDGVCDGVDQCPNTPRGVDVDERGCEQGATGGASATERQLVETGAIRLENVYFESRSAKLLPESEASLREAGAALAKYPDLRIEVEGHTDSRGESDFNQKLSQERAEAVRDYLLAHNRLRPENVTARGYGESRLETAERNSEEMMRNRRVVLRVLNPSALPREVKIER